MAKKSERDEILEVWEIAPDDATVEEIMWQAERVAKRLVDEKMAEEYEIGSETAESFVTYSRKVRVGG